MAQSCSRKVLVPGTFDPITLGHLDVILRSASLFDEVVVGVAASRNKRGGTLFDLDERVELVQTATSQLSNVSVEAFECLLTEFAASIGADAVVKGLRVTTDFEYEFQMAALNYRQSPELETLFVMSSPEYMYISSSVARELASLSGSLDGIVTPEVADALRAKFSA